MRVHAEVTDATHLTLCQPMTLPTGTFVVVEIVAADSDRETFLDASASLLERAYGDDEPDYSQAGDALFHAPGP